MGETRMTPCATGFEGVVHQFGYILCSFGHPGIVPKPEEPQNRRVGPSAIPIPSDTL